jgi:hypothetical protein
MAATINKVRLAAFFHTGRKLQPFHTQNAAAKHCFHSCFGWMSERDGG